MKEKIKVGIDLGGSHIAIGVINNEHKIMQKYEKDFSESDKLDIITVIEEYILTTVYEIQEEYEIELIGIAIPGTTSNGKIVRAVNLGIYNYDIVKSLNSKLDVKISLRNDAKCAALAEYNNLLKMEFSNNELSLKKLTCKSVDINALQNEEDNYRIPNILFLSIGTGIGGGVIYNGKLLSGNDYEGYELGHIVIKENGIPCKCGRNGCFERYGSILSYKNKIKERLNIPQYVNGDSLRMIMDENKEKIEDLKEQYVFDLALGISNLINIFEPDIVILGGGFIHFDYMFMEDIKFKLLNSNLLFNKRDFLDLRVAKLGNDAGIIGAVI